MMQRCLDLYCGSKSIAKVAELKGFVTLTLDKEVRFKPDVVWDILKPFDVFWASPPCTSFSVASIGKHWKVVGGIPVPISEGACVGLDILDRTVGLIAVLKPMFWFIENPRGMMRKVIEGIFKKWGVKGYVRRTVSYCQYGDVRMKPTDVWTNNLNWKPKKMCLNGSSCHVSAPRGSHTGTQGLKGNYERSVIPEALCQEIIKSCGGVLE